MCAKMGGASTHVRCSNVVHAHMRNYGGGTAPRGETLWGHRTPVPPGSAAYGSQWLILVSDQERAMTLLRVHYFHVHVSYFGYVVVSFSLRSHNRTVQRISTHLCTLNLCRKHLYTATCIVCYTPLLHTVQCHDIHVHRKAISTGLMAHHLPSPLDSTLYTWWRKEETRIRPGYRV